LVLIVVTALAASSMDTLQSAISCVFSHDLLRFGMSDRVITWITRILLLAINIPAVIMSSQRYDVIGLFLVADIVCATAVFPVFLGLITEDIWWFLPAPTELAAFLGIITGIGAVLVNGKVIGFTEAVSYGEVIATGPSSYFWLTNSTQCAVCGTETMITFIITPLVAGFFTIFFSVIDIKLRGQRAREPLFQTGFFFDTMNKVDIKLRGDRAVERPIFNIEAKQDSVHYNFAAASKEEAEVGENCNADGGTSEGNVELGGVETAKEEGGIEANDDDLFVEDPNPKELAQDAKPIEAEVI